MPTSGIISWIACGAIEGDSAANGAANVTAFNDFIGYAQDNDISAAVYSAGPTLLFPEGHYHFNAHLNLKASVHLLGSGGWPLFAAAAPHPTRTGDRNCLESRLQWP